MHSSRTFQAPLQASPLLSQLSRSRLGLVIAGFVVLGMVLLVTARFTDAHADLSSPSPRPNVTAERLTHTLVTLDAQHQQAGSAEQVRFLS